MRIEEDVAEHEDKRTADAGLELADGMGQSKGTLLLYVLDGETVL